MYINFIDAQDNLFILPESVMVDRIDVQGKQELFNLAFAHGGKTQGGYIKERIIQLTGTILSRSRSDNIYEMDQIKYLLSKPGLRIFPEGYYQRYIVSSAMIDFNHSWVERMDHEISKFTCSLRCDDPFFYDFNLSQSLFTMHEGVNTFSVFTGYLAGHSNCEFGQSPIITFTADQGVDVPSFTLKNTSDEDLQIRYSDPGFVAAEFAIIDCQKGTALRGTTRTERFLEGEFLRLVNNENVFEYDGPACGISVLWRPRWL